jgi:D-beta-D-heptose 7-phosphate kinase/D-beta-D-heptose 1-phosphate adenosyltransferase
VVFTNGCFDLVHAGHVRYLRDARAFGDLLVVGLNSDASVRRLGKGPERPILGEGERAEILAALESVDYVTLFDEDTPLELVRALRPDVLVKGGDWAPDEVAGADVVRESGGRVEIVRYHPGLSTTEIVRRIRSIR